MAMVKSLVSEMQMEKKIQIGLITTQDLKALEILIAGKVYSGVWVRAKPICLSSIEATPHRGFVV